MTMGTVLFVTFLVADKTVPFFSCNFVTKRTVPDVTLRFFAEQVSGPDAFGGAVDG